MRRLTLNVTEKDETITKTLFQCRIKRNQRLNWLSQAKRRELSITMFTVEIVEINWRLGKLVTHKSVSATISRILQQYKYSECQSMNKF